MGEETQRKPVKVGIVAGQGPPPGYQWNIQILDVAHAEAMSFLDEDQRYHIACQFREMAMCEQPTLCPTVDIRAIDTYYELRDKGGILKRLNVRVFFFLNDERREIVILGTINKKNDGKTPQGTVILMRRRRRLYLEVN